MKTSPRVRLPWVVYSSGGWICRFCPLPPPLTASSEFFCVHRSGFSSIPSLSPGDVSPDVSSAPRCRTERRATLTRKTAAPDRPRRSRRPMADVPPPEPAHASLSLLQGRTSRERGTNRLRPRTGVGEDPKSKATAVPEERDEARGISTDRGGLDHPARWGRVAGKHSRVTGGWLVQLARRKASIPAPGGEDEGPGLGVERVPEEIRAIKGEPGPKTSVPQKTPACAPKPGALWRMHGAGAGLWEGAGCHASSWSVCPSTCSLSAAQSCSLPAPVPPPGMGRSASPGGGRGWRVEDEGGQPPA